MYQPRIWACAGWSTAQVQFRALVQLSVLVQSSVLVNKRTLNEHMQNHLIEPKQQLSNTIPQMITITRSYEIDNSITPINIYYATEKKFNDKLLRISSNA